MDALTTLPAWVQLLLVVLVAVVLIVLNGGWLLAIKGQIDARRREAARQRQPDQERTHTPPQP